MNYRIRKISALAFPMALAVVALGGCAMPFGSPKASATNSPDQRQQSLHFVQCMRQHGVDLPDPSADGSITIHGSASGTGDSGGPSLSGPGGLDPNSPTFQAAQTACQKYAPNGGKTTATSQDIKANQAKGLKFSQCMRSHGLPNFPDPQSNSSGGSTFNQATGPGAKQGGPGTGSGAAISINGETFTFDPSDPAFQKAQQACSSILGIKGGLGGPPPGSGGN
ncbi:MAG TPA: hypothetical protein VNV65_04095 [Candidatus Solibacter sp.]|jgi:hypothetical protein|nr:hypothetical protein [Candidatus Solibacter sp.]